MRSFLIALLLTAPPAVWAAEPWDLPPFASDAKALYSRAVEVESVEDEPVIGVLKEVTLVYSEDGRVERHDRLIYRIIDSSAIEGWSELSAYWSPWYQDQPELRARVIEPGGRVHEIDPKTIAQQPASDGTYSDARIDRAPLPGVVAGVVIEEMHTVREHRRFFSAGSIERFSPGLSVYTKKARLIVDAPESLKITYAARPDPLEPPVSEETADGRVRRVWEWNDLTPREDYEGSTPLDVLQFREVGVSTGTSWADVATEYGRIFEDVLRDADVADRTGKIVEGSNTAEEKIHRILASIQRDVRYVAIELGEGSIVPRTPAETLKRGFGDCKDQAALLIAMLRQAGIAAQPALLRAADYTDVNPALPGLGTFNHVIVHLPGSSIEWIDPTDEFARAGELPTSDAGRLALIAAPGESEMRRLPQAAADDVRNSVVIRYELAEAGNGTIRETIRPAGNYERISRRALAMSNRPDYDARLQEITKEKYLSKEAAVVVSTPATALEKPFEIALEARSAGRTATEGGEAAAALDVYAGFDYLPPGLLTLPEEGDERQHPWFFSEPTSMEHRFVIAAPDGYRARPLPEGREAVFGPLEWSVEWKLVDERTVEAVARLDSGPTLWTADQVNEAREAANAITRELEIVGFDQIARLHIGRGDLKAAIEEVERLAALHPAEALHPSELSSIFFTAGLNEAAVEAARRATSIAPDSSEAWQQLGWALQHDAVSRRFFPGWKREESIAAYRKAVELDPENTVARADLAILLEHDDLGIRYSSDVALDEAIELYRSLRKDSDAKEFDGNLAAALFRARHWQDLSAFMAEAQLDENTRDSMKVIAALMSGGADAATTLLDRLPMKRRGDVAVATAQLALIHREYPHVIHMLDQAARYVAPETAAELAAFREQMRMARKLDPESLDLSTPENVLKLALLASFDPRIDEAGVRRFAFEPSVPYLMKEDDPESFFSERITSEIAAREGNVASFTADLVAALLEPQVEKDDEGGAIARLRSDFTAQGVPEDVVFLLKQGDDWRYVGSSYQSEAIGTAIHTFLDAKQYDRAAQWLDWLVQARPRFRTDDPLLGDLLTFFWTEGDDADPEAMRTAAHILTLDTDPGTAGAAWLAERRDRWSGSRRDAVDMALITWHNEHEESEQVLPISSALLERHPSSEVAFMVHSSVLVETGADYDLDKMLGTSRMRRERERAIYRMIYAQAQQQGDLTRGAKALRELMGRGLHEAGDLNNLAWLSLFGAGSIEEGLELAQRASSNDSGIGGHAALLHTLATLYATAGRPAEARDALLKAVAQRGAMDLESHDWYVIGRIAEAYGVEQVARAAYLRVQSDDDEDGDATSTWRLASGRLEALGSPVR